MEGWIKIHRGILDWEWYDDTNAKILFLHLLLTCNFESKKWHGKTIERGQIVTSADNLAKALGLTARQIRYALEKLQSTQEIVTQTTNKYTLITICNYDKYQAYETTDCNENVNQMSNECKSNVNQMSTTKEYKNIRKKEYNKEYISDESDMHAPAKQTRKKYGEYNNVLLTDEEAEKLKAEYGEDTPYIVENYSQYKEMKGYKCKRDYLAIRKWGANAYYEQLKKQENGINNGRSSGSIQERAARIAEYAFAANGM